MSVLSPLRDFDLEGWCCSIFVNLGFMGWLKRDKGPEDNKIVSGTKIKSSNYLVARVAQARVWIQAKLTPDSDKRRKGHSPSWAYWSSETVTAQNIDGRNLNVCFR